MAVLGISNSVQLGATLLFGWSVAWLPLKSLSVANLPAQSELTATGPCVWRAELEATAGIQRLAATVQLEHAGAVWVGAYGFVNGSRVGTLSSSGSLRLLPGHLREGKNEIIFIAGWTGTEHPHNTTLQITAAPCNVALFI